MLSLSVIRPVYRGIGKGPGIYFGRQRGPELRALRVNSSANATEKPLLKTGVGLFYVAVSYG